MTFLNVKKEATKNNGNIFILVYIFAYKFCFVIDIFILDRWVELCKKTTTSFLALPPFKKKMLTHPPLFLFTSLCIFFYCSLLFSKKKTKVQCCLITVLQLFWFWWEKWENHVLVSETRNQNSVSEQFLQLLMIFSFAKKFSVTKLITLALKQFWGMSTVLQFFFWF